MSIVLIPDFCPTLQNGARKTGNGEQKGKVIVGKYYDTLEVESGNSAVA